MRHNILRIVFNLFLIGVFVALSGYFASPVFATGTQTVTTPPASTKAILVANDSSKTSNIACSEIKGQLEGYGSNYPFTSWPYGTLNEFKYDGTPPTTLTTYTNISNAPVTSPVITLKRTNNSVDWTSNFGIDFVMVKGGTNGTNIYIYVPAGTSGGSLTTPNGQGISHVSFCWDNPVTIKVDKSTAPDSLDGVEFNFTLKIPNYLKSVSGTSVSQSFNLSDSAGYKTFLDLPKGNFDLNENLTATEDSQWATSVLCTRKRSGTTSTIVNSSEDETIDLDELVGGDLVICTFTNTETAPSTRDLKVYKKDPAGNILGGWEFKLRVYGSSTVISTKTTTAGNPVTFSGLNVGTKYSVCETKQTGWTTNSPIDANGCQSVTIASGTGAVELVFVNTPPTRNIRVLKKDQDLNRLPGWQFIARLKPSGPSYGPVTTDANGEAAFLNLPLGTYEVCEIAQADWIALDPSSGCRDITLTTNTTTSMTATSDDVSTQTYTTNWLIFKNQRQVRSIKVVKKNQNDVGLQNWQIQATNSGTGVVYGPVTTNSSGEAQIDNLPFGTYEVCEILQAGWAYVSPANGCHTVVINESTPTNSASTSEGASTQTGTTPQLLKLTFKNRPLVPGIDIIKYTNDKDANDPNGNSTDLPRIEAGDPVTWKYVVHNTGEVAFDKSKVIVTDDQPGVTVSSSYTVLVGDDDTLLEPGEKWVFTATGTAKVLTFNMGDGTTTVEGCKTTDNLKRPVYKNKGTVVINITNGPTDYDYSHYCNPEDPKIAIKKYTNNADANDPNGTDVPKIASGATVTWEYEVTNIGNVPFAKANVSVTDDRGVTPVYQSGDTGNDNILSPGEVWIYTASASAVTLEFGQAAVVNGCKVNDIPRPTYNNTGTVKILPNNTPTASDPSHYCNPSSSSIVIKKYTNGQDADNENGTDVPKIAAGATVTWTYYVTNTGNVPFTLAQVVVDDSVSNVNPVLVPVSDVGNDQILSPGERWTYQAVGTAVNLLTPPAIDGFKVVQGCNEDNTSVYGTRATYKNIGTVVVPGASDDDPSYYCNPPAPGIVIKKYTSGGTVSTIPGADADNAAGADVPRIAPNGDIVWTYIVTNTGNISFTKANVSVTDNRGVEVSFEKVLNANGDDILGPGESWQYTAQGKALTLQVGDGDHIVEGCLTAQNVARPTYNNVGMVTVPGTSDDDPSHYCNPEGPGIQIEKYTNGKDADGANGSDVPRIAPDGAIEWTYVVSNTGNVPFAFANVHVTDDRGVTPVFDSVLVGDDDDILEPGEQWLYKASGNAEVLEYGLEYVVEGCLVGENNKRPTYNNTGTVTVDDGPSDTDPSHYCNPYEPGIFIKKYTNGEDADSPTGPVVQVGSTVTWTYVVTNSGNVALASIVVTDNIAGVTPVYISGDDNPANGKLDLTETWLYRTTGIAVAGQYANTGYVKGTPPEGPDVKDDDPSHYFASSPEVVAIGDRVWHDQNANGVQDNGEPGVPNVTVVLLGGDCVTPMNQSTTTNGSGIYGFSNLPQGSYCVQFNLATLPLGYTVSPQNVGDDGLDSDADPSTGKTQSVTVPGGEQNLTLDMGIYAPASLGDRVWHDLNANGVQDNGEPGVPDVTVKLLINNCTEVFMTTETDGGGIYSFANLTPGTYCVEFDLSTLPEGFFVSPHNVGDDALDSDGDPSNGKTQNVTLPSGASNLTLDMGIYHLAALGNRVWFDDNKNGIQDPGELNVAGVEVTLFDSNNQPVGDPVVTDANGEYIFTDLVPGTYYVVFTPGTLPAGYTFTTPNGGGITEDLDSDADATGKTQAVTIKSGDNYVDLDAGIFLGAPILGALGDCVWYDVNKNGIQDEGETGVEGVEVRLYTSGGVLVDTQNTGADCKYLFTGLSAGMYYVEFANVEGYSYTRYNVNGNSQDAVDSDPLVPWVDVSISAQNEAELGLPLIYNVSYTNTDATLAAVNVVISTTIPPGTTLQENGTVNDAWSCTGINPGDVCTLTLATLAANTSGSTTFAVVLDPSASQVPDFLDIFISMTQTTLARTQVVTLAEGETNLTVDAGIVLLESSLTVPTPTAPTNLPGQPQPKNRAIFMPVVSSGK